MTNILEQGILFGRLCELLGQFGYEGDDTCCYRRAEELDELVDVCKQLVAGLDCAPLKEYLICPDYKKEFDQYQEETLEGLLVAWDDNAKYHYVRQFILETILTRYGRSLNE